MPSIKKWLLCLVSTVSLGLFLAGCVSAPRVISIPRLSESEIPSLTRAGDYSDVLALINFAMVRDLNLPAVDGTVIFYPDRQAFESGLVAELQKDVEEAEKQFGPRARQILKAETIPDFARQTAAGSVAVGMSKRVLVDELYFRRYEWADRVRVLAHELTHTMERAMMADRIASPDVWVREGFAEWVSAKVMEAFGVESFQTRRERSIAVVAKAKHSQTAPLNLATTGSSQTWMPTPGLATNGQPLLAVDLLIEEKGLAEVLEYFRLFGTLDNREVNFTKAFGESSSAFERRFNEHLRGLIGE